MHGYLILDLNTGKLLSSFQITAQFGLHRSEGAGPDNPFYISGLLFALCRNASALDPNQDSLNLALTRLETPELALELALDNRTATLSAAFFPSCINPKTRRLICRELLELYLQYVQGLDANRTFRKVVRRELFPAVEIYLAENVGLRFPRCPAWIIVSSTPHPVGLGLRSPTNRRPVNVGMTSVVVGQVPTRRRPRLWPCCSTLEVHETVHSEDSIPEMCCYRVLRLNTSKGSSFREQLDMVVIGRAAETAAGLLVEDERTQEPYRLADITVPGGRGYSLSQRLIIAVRATVWVAIPVQDKDIASKPNEIACLAQTEIVSLLDFINNTADRMIQ